MADNKQMERMGRVTDILPMTMQDGMASTPQGGGYMDDIIAQYQRRIDEALAREHITLTDTAKQTEALFFPLLEFAESNEHCFTVRASMPAITFTKDTRHGWMKMVTYPMPNVR